MKKKTFAILIVGIFLISGVIGFIYIKMQQQVLEIDSENQEGISKYAEDYVEVLIKTSDNIPSKLDSNLWDVKTTEEFERASFRQGYIVDVRTGGWNWGTLERDGKRFIIVRVRKELWNDSWLEPTLDYSKPIYDILPESKDAEPVLKGYEEIRVRKYMIDLDSILSLEELTDLKDLPYDSKEIPELEIKIIEDFDKLVKKIDLENMPELWISHGSSGDFTMCEAGAPTCDYSTLTGFESGEQADLTAGGGTGNATLTISGAWTTNDTTTVGIDGWTCDEPNHVIIQTVGDSRHSGVWSETAYRLVPSATRGMFSKEPSTVIDGLQIWAPDGEGIYFLEGGNQTASNNLLVNRGIIVSGITAGDGIYFHIYNNIIGLVTFTGDRDIIIDDADIDMAVVYSNTMFGSSSVGLYALAGNTLAKNNVVFSTTNYDYYGGGFDGASDYNIAEDTTNTGGSNDKSSTTCSYVGGNDYRLSATDIECKDSGIDLSSDGNLSFSTDIEGDTRDEWDIGADEASNTNKLRKMTLDYNNLSADIAICETASHGECALTSDYEIQLKWDVSALRDLNTVSIEEANLQLYIVTKTGSPDNDAIVLYVTDQTWDESTVEFTLASQTVNNQSSETLSSIVVSTYTNISVLTQLTNTYKDNFSLRIYDTDYAVTSINGKVDTTTNNIGHSSTVYYGMGAREYATTSYRPKLFISYFIADSGDAFPTVTLTSPITDTSTLNTSIFHVCGVTDDGTIQNATFYIWNDEVSLFNSTTNSTVGLSSYSINITNYVVDSYEWNCYACDDASQCSWATSNNTLTILPYETEIISYNSSYDLADLEISNSTSGNQGIIMKWNSAFCDSTKGIESGVLQMYSAAVAGSNIDNTTTYYIQDQVWDESSSASTINGLSKYNSTNITWSDTPSGGYTNLTITNFIEEACVRGDNNMTILIDNWNYPIETISTTSDDTSYSIGDASNYMTMGSREQGTVGYRPMLFIETYNLSNSEWMENNLTADINSTYFGDEVKFYWNETSGYSIEECKIDFDGVNYSGTINGVNCNYTYSFDDTQNNITHNITGWIKINDGYESSTDFITLTTWYTQDKVDGYWVFRAPVNISSMEYGNSYAMRYATVNGNGQDTGVLWRADTLDEDSNTLQDEERHCGAWTQFWFDEPNISAGNFSNVYCHVWLSSPNVGLGYDTEGDYAIDYERQLDTSDPEVLTAGDATFYHLMIVNDTSFGYSFYNNESLWNISFVSTGTNIQVMSYPNQKSFCIINSLNGIDLDDTVALNSTDSDSDGLTDYQEMYETFTDPLDNDTDDDNHNDQAELDNDKKGWNPYDWGIINKYQANSSQVTITFNSTNNSASELFPESHTETLPYSFTEAELANLSKYTLAGFDNIKVPVEITDAGYYALGQVNFKINVTQNVSSITNVNIFLGGKTTVGGGDVETLNNSLDILNNTDPNSIIYVPGKKGATKALFLKQMRNNGSIIINETDNTINLRWFIKTTADNVDYKQQIDFFEVWITTGGNEINILNPTEGLPVSVEYPQNITVNFTLTEDGTELVSGVTVENITIGETLCPLQGELVYQTNHWEQKCTIPDLDYGYNNIIITGNSSTSGFLSDTENNAVYYEPPYCWTKETGKLIIPPTCKYYSNILEGLIPN